MACFAASRIVSRLPSAQRYHKAKEPKTAWSRSEASARALAQESPLQFSLTDRPGERTTLGTALHRWVAADLGIMSTPGDISRRGRGREWELQAVSQKDGDVQTDSKMEDEDAAELMGAGAGGACDPLCSVDDMTSQEYAEVASKEKSDIIKAVVIGTVITVGAGIINHEWVETHQEIALSAVFILGYAGIIFEEALAFNKSGVALLMAVSLWVIHSLGSPTSDAAVADLTEQSAGISQIVFFLLGAMTIVEIVDAHQGFRIITDTITTRNSRTLLWLVGLITFFMSAILDNLTSTIVMVSLLRKLVSNPMQRRLLGAVVVIAANAGGAWTPIGDVTTTMLWVNGNISTVHTMQDLFLPSFMSLVVPLTIFSFDKDVSDVPTSSGGAVMSSEQMAPRGRLVFAVGVGSLLFVPIFKATTGLPPFLGMLCGLGALWLLTDAIHYGEEDRQKLKVPQALSRIDTQGVLFFLGILLSVASLDSAGLLKELAGFLDSNIGNVEVIAASIGLASAVIDNVPLVAATMGMYSISAVPQDSELWQLIAFCAGTGGSILIIGSAAGVALMGMEKTDFLWYFKKVSGVALAGYIAGMAVYLAEHSISIPISSFVASAATAPLAMLQSLLPF
eukprot:TRINITY_DN2110_c0_g1_i1.p1 TRINITY_DN2110_c0_g1~~TRINITY_DN2110_c0_g1_i1.p1  ORF type:complete len:642 (+),score=178.70 TRINITY_DN2110_c0_g1_i1:61-1926(+)